MAVRLVSILAGLAILTLSGMACADDGSAHRLPEGAVLVALAGGESVVVLDENAERVIMRIQVGREPHMLDMTETPAGERVAFVAVTEADRVVRLPLASLSDDGGRRIKVGSRPHQISITRDGAWAVVTNEGEAFLSIFATDESRRPARIGVDERPFHIAMASDGRSAWVSYNGRDYVTVVERPAGLPDGARRRHAGRD
jgi:DNA-binding beta-propeller fold protein YncE